MPARPWGCGGPWGHPIPRESHRGHRQELAVTQRGQGTPACLHTSPSPPPSEANSPAGRPTPPQRPGSRRPDPRPGLVWAVTQVENQHVTGVPFPGSLSVGRDGTGSGYGRGAAGPAKPEPSAPPRARCLRSLETAVLPVASFWGCKGRGSAGGDPGELASLTRLWNAVQCPSFGSRQ